MTSAWRSSICGHSLPRVPPVPPPPVVDAALALRRLLLRAADGLLPPWAAVWDRTMGVARTEIIGVIAELGVADELAAGPLTAAELASRLGLLPARRPQASLGPAP